MWPLHDSYNRAAASCKLLLCLFVSAAGCHMVGMRAATLIFDDDRPAEPGLVGGRG